MKKFRNKIAVKGSKALLRAFSEELNEMGYKLIGKDIDNYEGYSGPCDPKYITTNGKHLVCKNGEYTFAMNEGSENSWLTLPEDYTKAIQLASEVEEEIPEYVKCIKSHKNQFTKGKIYETRDYFGSVKKDDTGNSNGINAERYFIPATKAEYDAQELEFKKKELLEEARKKFPIGSKVKLLNDDIIEIAASPYYNDGDSTVIWNSTGYGRLYSEGQWATIVEDEFPKYVRCINVSNGNPTGIELNKCYEVEGVEFCKTCGTKFLLLKNINLFGARRCNKCNNIYAVSSNAFHVDRFLEITKEVFDRDKEDTIEIAGYKAEVKDGRIAFGCKKFSKEDLEAIKRVLNLSYKLELDFNFGTTDELLIIYDGEGHIIRNTDLIKLINKL